MLTKMPYRYLGNSGMRVSVLGWGNWINNSKEDKITYDTIKFGVENGINFIDTAEIYGFGQGEICIGNALEKLGSTLREDLVISSKIYRAGVGVNQTFLSRKHIIEGVNNSLKRLKIGYLDIVFCHRYDNYTPMEEICRAMNRVIEDGKAFYWGTSEWQAAQIMEAHACCERLGLIKPIVEQCQYNMFIRERLEKEYEALFKTIKLGTTTWSPLMSGILTGKYIDDIPKGSRFDKYSSMANTQYKEYKTNKPKYDEKLKKLKTIAEKLDCSLTNLAIAWVIKNPDVSTCLLGVSKVEQLKENLKAIELMNLITNDVEEEISKILDNTPKPEIDWRDFKETQGRRKEAMKLL